ncbi:MAG: NAD(P)/FAD-dependent oxidoreductase [Phocaeicola sp.]
MKVAIIGGGAAGFFTAINLKELAPNADVTIYEAAPRVLAKVAITGGGRCNLTNSFREIKNLSVAYPRGTNLMKRTLKAFGHKETYAWFEAHGIKLTTQEDECVFPCSQQAQEIIDTFLKLAKQHNITIKTSHRVAQINRSENQLELSFVDAKLKPVEASCVVVTTGGSPKKEGLSMLQQFQLKIEEPVPSLFTFCLPDNPITQLMGTVVERATATVTGTKLSASGPLLITHWGMSGPAILKLSSYAARLLHKKEYTATIAINWVNGEKEQQVVEELRTMAKDHAKKQMGTIRPYNLPTRLWHHLLQSIGIELTRKWEELGRKQMNRLVNSLINDQHLIKGQHRFKEEFVTCGGISLENINPSTLACKEISNLYLAGEVLDVDAITGGFNLQAAWSMGMVVARSIAELVNNPHRETIQC